MERRRAEESQGNTGVTLRSLSYTTQAHQPRDGATYSGLGPAPSTTGKEMPHTGRRPSQPDEGNSSLEIRSFQVSQVDTRCQL